MTAYIAEVFATALMVLLGNGVVANVHLKGSKGHKMGWMVISTGWGFAVGIPAIIFGGISGNHINPAFTLGLALNGKFPWEKVAPYITAQLIGAFIGGFVVWLMYKPFLDNTEDTIDVLGCFGSVPSYKRSYINAFITELIGTFILVFGALGIVHSPLMGKDLLTAHMNIGFLVWALVLSVGGPTGPALNPARDIMPRLVHTLLPIKGKGSSHWNYVWVPVIAPIIGSIIGVYTYFQLFSTQ